MTPVLIEVANLVKKFDEITAVDSVSFEIREGEMFALVGPDGAGKTTTMRNICGLQSPNSGAIKVFGLDSVKQKKKIQREIGYLSQRFSLYGDLSVDENIEFFASIHNVRGFQTRRDELLEFTRLKPFRDRFADRLSGGMKQKLALACSLIHKPKILFLDEPTTGVDPVSRRDFWRILSGLQQEGLTVFMATPYLDEAERCNRVGLMHKGKLLKLDTPDELKKGIEMEVLEIVTGSVRQLRDSITASFGYDVQLFGDRVNVLIPAGQGRERAVLEAVHTADIVITSHRTMLPKLENVFIYSVSMSEEQERGGHRE